MHVLFSHGLRGAAHNWRDQVKKVLAAVLVLSLSACASTPIPTESAQAVPANRMTNLAFFQSRDGFGKIVIKRDSEKSPRSITTTVYANGIAVADVNAGEKVEIYLPEGEQIIGALTNYRGGGGTRTEAMIVVKRDRPIVYAISYGPDGGDMKFQPTTF